MIKLRYECIEMAEKYLDERYSIMNMDSNNISNKIAYERSLKTIEMLGLEWRRDENGNHKILMGYNYD